MDSRNQYQLSIFKKSDARQEVLSWRKAQPSFHTWLYTKINFLCVGTKLFINNSWKGPRSPDLEWKTSKLPIKSGNAFHLTSTINIKNSKRQNLLTFFFRQNEAEEDTCRNSSAQQSQATTLKSVFFSMMVPPRIFFHVRKKVPVACSFRKIARPT